MIKFGTGGWRAIIADGFTKENIRLLTAGLCALMEKEGHAGAEICVGYDRRFLSKESAHWACEVLAGYGFRPYVINRSSPTPLIMFTVKRRNMPYGMAVTASHNPAAYNGYKVYGPDGCQITSDAADEISAAIQTVDPFDGVITGCILSVGRILGESAALLFTAGTAHALYSFFEGLGQSGATLTVALYFYAKEQGEFDVAFAIAAVLMLLTLCINLAAALVERHFRRKRSL